MSENVTKEQIENYYVSLIKDNFGIEEDEKAKELFYDALTYNVVSSEVLNQIAFLLEGTCSAEEGAYDEI